MDQNSAALFHFIPDDARARIFSRLRRQRFESGAVVIAEGDERKQIYVIDSGSARVTVDDRHGIEHTVNQVGPGDTLGEMSFLTGLPASASVTAITQLDVVVIGGDEFGGIAREFPQLYQEIGRILAHRLGRQTKKALHSISGRCTILTLDAAPPESGYALACSVAWHTRQHALLLIVSKNPDHAKQQLADVLPAGRICCSRNPKPRLDSPPCADVLIAEPVNEFSAENLAFTLQDFSGHYEHLLVQMPTNGTDLKPLDESPARHLTVCTATAALTEDRACYISPRQKHIQHRSYPAEDATLHVPPLTAADRAALGRGTLPASTFASRAIGWAARDISGLRVGLALGAGSSRGYAHIGVLRVFEQLSLTLDCIVGASIGAGVAILHAIGRNPDQASVALDRIGSSTFRLTLSRKSMLSIAGVRDGVRDIIGELKFEDLQLPLAVVATDIETGEPVVFNRGTVWPPMVASLAIPGIYPPQLVGSRLLVDGGVANPVPSDIAAAMGADVVLAVKLRNQGNGHPRNGVEVLLRAFDTMQDQIMSSADGAETILIEPAFSRKMQSSLRSFVEGRGFIELGEKAALEALPRLKSAIPWLRSES